MGVPGGMPGTAGALVAAVAGAAERGVLVGDRHRAHDHAGDVRRPGGGGHLRVGMEDVVTWARGVPVRDNAQLVERAASAATLFQRPPMPPDDARSLLKVKDRRGVAA